MNSDILGLRDWRQSRGITLDAIASSTKLSVRQLLAIESGDFRKLPGGIYNINYIRQYARAIDFDESELLAFYESFCGGAMKDAQPGARRSLSGPLLQN